MNRRTLGSALMVAGPLSAVAGDLAVPLTYAAFVPHPIIPSESVQIMLLGIMTAVAFLGAGIMAIGANVWVKATPRERVAEVIDALDFTKRILPSTR